MNIGVENFDTKKIKMQVLHAPRVYILLFTRGESGNSVLILVEENGSPLV